MSIIHDALKKVQQGLTSKSNEMPVSPEKTEQSNGYLYDAPVESLSPTPPKHVESSTPVPNKTKSMLALICAMAITLGALGFFYKQLNTYFPQFKRSIKSSFYQLIHKKEIPEFKTRDPKDLIPLAQLTVNEPKPLGPPATPANPPAISNIAKPQAPVTLNIHGVMSNGSNNLVLINDQVYQQGDDVDGVKIVKIDLNSITVINDGKEEKIRVKN